MSRHECLCQARIRTNNVPIQTAVAIALSVALALQHIHARGILHLDIKCGNIMLPRRRSSKTKLIDFEIANWLTVFRHTGVFITRATRSKPGLDLRSDLYSLGVALLVMLTGLKPIPFGE